MSKSDDQLRSEIESNEAYGEWGAWAVVVGLVLEIVLATANSLGYGNKDVENWGAVVADCLVALGVYVEIRFGRKAAQGQREQVARANERAAKLEKEAADARGRVADIERLTAYRHISDEQRELIVQSLRPIADTLDVFIEYQAGDPEAWSYASEIAEIFQLAGAKEVGGAPNSFPFNTVFGAWMSGAPEINISFVRSCFTKAHFQISENAHNPLWMPPKRPAPNVRIFVGPKPPPAFPGLPHDTDGMSSAVSASETTAALEKAATDALRRAEQVGRQVGPRNIDRKLFLEPIALAGDIRGRIEILYAADNAESYALALQLRGTLEEAKWTVVSNETAPTAEILKKAVVLPMHVVLEAKILETKADFETWSLLSFGKKPEGDVTLLGVLMGTLMRAGATVSASKSDPSLPEGQIRVVIGPR